MFIYFKFNSSYFYRICFVENSPGVSAIKKKKPKKPKLKYNYFHLKASRIAAYNGDGDDDEEIEVGIDSRDLETSPREQNSSRRSASVHPEPSQDGNGNELAGDSSKSIAAPSHNQVMKTALMKHRKDTTARGNYDSAENSKKQVKVSNSLGRRFRLRRNGRRMVSALEESAERITIASTTGDDDMVCIASAEY